MQLIDNNINNKGGEIMSRKNKPSDAHRRNMLKDYGHVHNYNIFVGTTIENGHLFSIYKCSRDDATTMQKR